MNQNDIDTIQRAQANLADFAAQHVAPPVYQAVIDVSVPYDDGFVEYHEFGRDLGELRRRAHVAMAKIAPLALWDFHPDDEDAAYYDDPKGNGYAMTILQLELVC